MSTGPVIPVGPGPVGPGPVGPGPVIPGPVPPTAGPAAVIQAVQPHNFTVDAAQYIDNGSPDPTVNISGTVEGVPVVVGVPLSMIQNAPNSAALQQLLANALLERARKFVTEIQAIKTPAAINIGPFTL